MNDLDPKEQNHVRVALHHLRRRLGTWAVVADGLHWSRHSLKPVMSGKKPVSASMALRVARLAGVMIDDLLVGRIFPPGACPKCGHMSDFNDENTIVEGSPRQPAAGLTLVK